MLEIKGRLNEQPVLNHTALIQLSSAAAMTSASKTASPVALGSLIWDDTTTYALTGTITGAAQNIKYVVVGIYTKDQRTLVPGQYLTADQAHDGNHWLKVIPVGGVVFETEEDAASDVIATSEADAGWYSNLVITDPTAPDLSQNCYQDTYTTVQLDSSAAAAADSNHLVQLISTQDRRAAATGRKRRFRFQVIAAHAQASQA
ncbi:MAG: hypothetical protein ABFD89_04800 [Bryobacteraceae bacterium]